MAFFRFGKNLQLLLIAGALAAAPGCYESSGGHRDAATDPRQDDVLEEEPIIVDPPPSPMCEQVPLMALDVMSTQAGRTYLEGSLRLNTSEWVNCVPRPVCVEATLGGAGRIASLEQTGTYDAQFRYENDAMSFMDQISAQFTWYVKCYDESYNEYEETVTRTVWFCLDENTETIQVTDSAMECPMVVDCVPSPISSLEKNGPLRIVGQPAGDGSLLLTLEGGAGAPRDIRWAASAGSLSVLEPGRAVFRPDDDEAMQVVQVSVLGEQGVTVEVFRVRKT